MGTSSSSKGSPSNVPMVPPWVPEVPDEPPTDAPPSDAQHDTPEDENLDLAATIGDDNVKLAPPGRFGSARLNLASFARYSDRPAMRRAIGQYVSQGYGGSGYATRRMGGTIRSSQALLSSLSGGPGSALQAPGAALNYTVLAGQSADEIMDAVTDAVRPVDGTQDSESSRAAIRDSLAETLERFPDADLLNLTEEQKEYAVEAFVAGDIVGRIFLDLGTHVIEHAPSMAAGLSRLKEIRDYVRETVAEAFRTLRAKGLSLSGHRVAIVVRDAIRETFAVFEGYAQ